MSALMYFAPELLTACRPRLSKYNSIPRATASWLTDVLMLPVPPMNKTRMVVSLIILDDCNLLLRPWNGSVPLNARPQFVTFALSRRWLIISPKLSEHGPHDGQHDRIYEFVL